MCQQALLLQEFAGTFILSVLPAAGSNAAGSNDILRQFCRIADIVGAGNLLVAEKF